ncbi:general L-amino acid transport system permease protein [Ketogulonicigenium robustum]|uniref:General L-amino acid transport system permease protein n=1 Tax=Ketogulonicigenium robustum TaxID=92947 RepID=A0A1W6P206_9RHOB|nr:amino acid ABC transporter permease [Ketogulonicigenium robustum]ARO15516.1 general L-amino acid transport system permease protein [Ketogulonicigenium robustum]
MADPKIAYVRETMLPPQAPPGNDTGAVSWIRENLLSSWLNVILTVLSLWLVYYVVSHVAPWLLRGIWQADSLAQCRQIRDEMYGAGANVACFAVITERWNQLVFGFYPRSGYWRVILAFVLLVVAIAPVLFAALPRKMLWFSLVSPLLMFFLIWGGTIWGPIAVGLGLAAMVGAGVLVTRKRGMLLGVLVAIGVGILWFLNPFAIVWNGVGGAGNPLGFLFPIDSLITRIGDAVAPGLALPRVLSKDIGGFTLSFIIGIAGIALSLPLGILLALGRKSNMLIINTLSVAFIEVIRGVPLIVWLFTASLLLNYFMPPGTNFDLMLRVIIMVTLFSAAYIAEVVRGGLAAIPKGQYEAADALGLDYWKAMRLIILPQALKISIPGIVNTFIGLFKDTTLVVFIGMMDPVNLLGSIRANTAWNGIYWELFLFVGLMFFIVCFLMSRYSIYLEKRLRREHR